VSQPFALTPPMHAHFEPEGITKVSTNCPVCHDLGQGPICAPPTPRPVDHARTTRRPLLTTAAANSSSDEQRGESSGWTRGRDPPPIRRPRIGMLVQLGFQVWASRCGHERTRHRQDGSTRAGKASHAGLRLCDRVMKREEWISNRNRLMKVRQCAMEGDWGRVGEGHRGKLRLACAPVRSQYARHVDTGSSAGTETQEVERGGERQERG